ncbi:MAG: hypothetical protein K0R54_5128 [Clostridiaceae bacterium]|jgi:hypothetical protein|nr:hypothetical protein [Clostridiaceae bacterium]
MKIKSEIQPEKTYTIKMSFLNKYPIEEAIRRLVMSYNK